MSPTPNWSSIRMKTPERKSRTSDCEPKPSATPRIPAPASSGPSSIPTSPRIMKPATAQISAATSERRTLASASMRCSARRLCSRVSSSASGVAARSVPSRSCTAPDCSVRSAPFMPRRARRLAISAPTTIATIFRGFPMMKSASSASVRSSVWSRTSRQTQPGSSPQTSRRRPSETAAKVVSNIGHPP